MGCFRRAAEGTQAFLGALRHDLASPLGACMRRWGRGPAARRTTAPAKVAQELLGHSQISMTLDIYSHVLPNMQRDAIELLNQALSAAQGTDDDDDEE